MAESGWTTIESDPGVRNYKRNLGQLVRVYRMKSDYESDQFFLSFAS